MGRWIAGLCALFVLTMVSGASAAPFLPLEPLFWQGPDGAAVHQQRMAVNGVTGRLYVTDDVNDQIRVFDGTATGAAEGLPFGAGVVTDPLGVAVDQETGAVYVSDDNDIVKFSSAGVLDPSFTSPAGITGPLAFDQAHDELVVADTAADVIRHYTPSGAVAGAAFDGSDGNKRFGGLQDVATTSTGDVVVVDAVNNLDPAMNPANIVFVRRYGAAGSYKAMYGPVTSAARVAVRLSDDEVYVSGNQASVVSSLPLQVSVFAAGGERRTVLTLPGEPYASGSTLYGTVSGLAITAGAAARLYVGTDVDHAYGGGSGGTSVQVYERPAASAPTVTNVSATKRTVASVQLNARVDAHYEPTTYYFQYGQDTGYGSTAPAVPQSAGATTGLSVSQVVDDLKPATVYHYRVVATNATGTTTSADRTFTTLSMPPASRQYEQVSPVDKHGSGVWGDGTGTTLLSRDGEGIRYNAFASFGDSPSSSQQTGYMSRREDDGWTTSPLEIPTRHQGGLAFFSTVIAVSSDMTHSVVGSRRALASGAIERQANVYLRDNRNGQLELMFTTPAPGGAIINTGSFGYVFGTPDFSHVVLYEHLPLTVGVPDDGKYRAYEYTGGHLRLVSVLPNGDETQAGFFDSVHRGLETLASSISEDGSRIYFDVADGLRSYGGLYVRVNGTYTVEISVSRRSGDAGTSQLGGFMGASADGSIVYFTSRAALTDDAVAPTLGGGNGEKNGGPLYRYDTVTDELIDITATADPADQGEYGAAQFFGTDRTGRYAYFDSDSKLIPGAGVAGSNTYVWYDGAVRRIAQASTRWRLSANRRFAVTITNAALTNDDHTCVSGSCAAVYRYSFDENTVVCVSCSPDGRRSEGDASLAFTGSSVTDTGDVLFTTPDRLDVDDVNGQRDAYWWSDGDAKLISSGRSPDPSTAQAVSDDGKNAYFATSEQLVGQDIDNAVDMYDARIGGGIAGQNPARPSEPCSGDACQATGRTAPVGFADAGTVTFAGSGNPRVLLRVGASGTVRYSVPKSVVGSRATLTVRVPSAGTVKVSGSGLVVVSRKAGKAGTVKLVLGLTERAKATLARRHRLKVAARVTFSPRGAQVRRSTVSVTFKQPAASVKRKGGA